MLLYKEKIGVVLSDSGFSRYLTVKDIKDILKNTYIAFDEQLFTKYIEKYQLSADKKLEQFSLGMKAKLKLITAISHKAKLLILDEPTAGLDVMARNEMLDMLRDYMEEDEEQLKILDPQYLIRIKKNLTDTHVLQIRNNQSNLILMSSHPHLQLTNKQNLNIKNRLFSLEHMSSSALNEQ